MTKGANLKNNKMKTYRITYRMEVFINADSEEEAQNIFDNAQEFNDLNHEYIEQDSIEEYSENYSSKKITTDEYYLSTNDFVDSNDLKEEVLLILGEDWIAEDDVEQIQLILDKLFGKKQYLVQCIEGLKSDYDIQIIKL